MKSSIVHYARKDWLDGHEDHLTAQREFDPIFGHLKNPFFGSNPLEFICGAIKIGHG